MENQPNQEQEVDLVPIFVWIGNGFKNLFKGIVNLFKGFGHCIILFLIFIQQNIILVAITTIVGIATGWYFNNQVNDQYSAQVVVKPNFNSTGQLISNVTNYQSLIDQQDYTNLATALNISQQQAQQITGITIHPEFNETELLKEYDKLARKSDTIALEYFTFQGFKSAKRDVDYEFQRIEITGYDRSVLDQISNTIVQVKENSIIKAERQALVESAQFNLNSIQLQLTELDSLILAYQTAIKTSNTQSGNGTNLYLGDQKPSEALKNLFDKKKSLLFEMSEVRKDKYSYNETIHIISQFIKKGTISKQYYLTKGAFIGLGFGLLLALIPIIWKFLKNYQK